MTDTQTLLTQMTNDLKVTSDALQRLCRRRRVLCELATKLRTGAHPAIIEAEMEVTLTEQTSSPAPSMIPVQRQRVVPLPYG